MLFEKFNLINGNNFFFGERKTQNKFLGMNEFEWKLGHGSLYVG